MPVQTAATCDIDYERLIAGLDEVVFRFNADGRWTFLNPAWQKRLGHGSAESLGRRAVRYVHPADRAAVLARWREVAAGRHEDFCGEVRFQIRGGGCRWMLVAARAHRDAMGSLSGATGTLTDVTAAKEAEAQLIAARAAAEVGNKTKTEFLATLSHELRTPLNAVIGLSDSLLETGADLPEEQRRRYLGIIRDSGRQLLAQINDFLELVRIDSGRAIAKPGPVNLRALCSSVLEVIARDARAKSLRTEFMAPGDELILEADARLLRHALIHLLRNAVKFTPAGGQIIVTLSAAHRCATVTIADTGVGIASDKMHLLFKPFSQVDASIARGFGGAGVGLVLVDRIVRLHGGEVRVASEVGRGTAFTIELPTKSQEAKPMVTRPGNAAQTP